MASLLPNGEQVFLDDNGVPLALGTVEFYVPLTSTPKDTWQDAAMGVLNTNPVNLDAAGRAIIYGAGAYRQVVKDALGNLIWDQETSEPTSDFIWGGISAGTANAQTLVAPAFSSEPGQTITFVAGVSNTGATTINVSGSGPIPVRINGVAGPVVLSGGEIVSGDSYIIQYNSVLGAFILINPGIFTGSIVQSVFASYATNADIATAIPFDDTIPQVGEGTQILSVSITPRSTTNKLRATFMGFGSNNTNNAGITAALFSQLSANAMQVVLAIHPTTLELVLAMTWEWTPGAVTAQTVTIRAGGASNIIRFNGSVVGGRLYGGAASATLLVQEIKA